MKEGQTYLAHAKVEHGNLEIKKDECYFSLSSLASHKTYDDNKMHKLLKDININVKGNGKFKKDFSVASIEGEVGASHSDFGKIEKLNLIASYEDDVLSVQNRKSLDNQNNFNLVADIKTKEI